MKPMKQIKPRRKKRGKSFFDMTSAERDRYVAQFDREIDVAKDTKPLTAKQRAIFERARTAGGAGMHRIHAFDIDQTLLNDAAIYARKMHLTLAQVVERGLRRELAVD